jgi:hypothetical protein
MDLHGLAFGKRVPLGPTPFPRVAAIGVATIGVAAIILYRRIVPATVVFAPVFPRTAIPTRSQVLEKSSHGPFGPIDCIVHYALRGTADAAVILSTLLTLWMRDS